MTTLAPFLMEFSISIVLRYYQAIKLSCSLDYCQRKIVIFREYWNFFLFIGLLLIHMHLRVFVSKINPLFVLSQFSRREGLLSQIELLRFDGLISHLYIWFWHGIYYSFMFLCIGCKCVFRIFMGGGIFHVGGGGKYFHKRIKNLFIYVLLRFTNQTHFVGSSSLIPPPLIRPW